MKFTGNIEIVEKYGRFGAFNVGTLKTQVGEFVVKNELLDQYDPGNYEVAVEISEIYLGGYRWGTTQNVTQLCARIEYIECLSDEIEPVEDEEYSVDPIEESEDTESIEKAFEHNAQIANSDDAVEVLGNELAQAFYNQVPFNLDMTVDRMKLRSQTNWLREHGYAFFASDRLWKPINE